jgi:D-beta-D-heptose 7-phosphate kinase/D-beta-D-heptose 1-phosphate adenosyltransferase
VTIVKPNRAELSLASRIPCETDEQVEIAAGKVMSDCAIGAMLVTRSERGMSLVQRGSVTRHLAAKSLEVFDVSGAGDTVMAAASVAIASGASLPVAAELANVAGGIVVGKVGTAVVSQDELAARLLATVISSSETKIISATAAAAAARAWRGRGLKVGFTNGCFDLLHPGHIALLTESRAACDRLIVAINSDESVKRLKGEERPVQSEASRAIVLASLALVDRVVVFSEDDPLSLLEQIRPDVLIKGGDYKLDEVVGGSLVLGYGGQVKLANHVPGHSSTNVIARMSGRKTRESRPPTTHAAHSNPR